MEPAQKAFWEAIGADGLVKIEDLTGRIDDVLVKHLELIRLDGVDNYGLYNGGIMHGGATQAAVDLAERANGGVGVINDTPTGKALEPFARLAGNIQDGNNLETLRARYGEYLTVPPDLNDPFVQIFENKGWNVFKPTSAHFAHHATDNVIRITPNATADCVYVQSEVPHIADGMRPDPETGLRRITHINGLPVETFDQTLENCRPWKVRPTAQQKHSHRVTVNASSALINRCA